MKTLILLVICLGLASCSSKPDQSLVKNQASISNASDTEERYTDALGKDWELREASNVKVVAQENGMVEVWNQDTNRRLLLKDSCSNVLERRKISRPIKEPAYISRRMGIDPLAKVFFIPYEKGHRYRGAKMLTIACGGQEEEVKVVEIPDRPPLKDTNRYTLTMIKMLDEGTLEYYVWSGW